MKTHIHKLQGAQNTLGYAISKLIGDSDRNGAMELLDLLTRKLDELHNDLLADVETGYTEYPLADAIARAEEESRKLNKVILDSYLENLKYFPKQGQN